MLEKEFTINEGRLREKRKVEILFWVPEVKKEIMKSSKLIINDIIVAEIKAPEIWGKVIKKNVLILPAPRS